MTLMMVNNGGVGRVKGVVFNLINMIYFYIYLLVHYVSMTLIISLPVSVESIC